ncbi:hypothetical protein QTN25_009910 [Entamoeba marina]
MQTSTEATSNPPKPIIICPDESDDTQTLGPEDYTMEILEHNPGDTYGESYVLSSARDCQRYKETHDNQDPRKPERQSEQNDKTNKAPAKSKNQKQLIVNLDDSCPFESTNDETEATGTCGTMATLETISRCDDTRLDEGETSVVYDDSDLFNDNYINNPKEPEGESLYDRVKTIDDQYNDPERLKKSTSFAEESRLNSIRMNMHDKLNKELAPVQYSPDKQQIIDITSASIVGSNLKEDKTISSKSKENVGDSEEGKFQTMEILCDENEPKGEDLFLESMDEDEVRSALEEIVNNLKEMVVGCGNNKNKAVKRSVMKKMVKDDKVTSEEKDGKRDETEDKNEKEVGEKCDEKVINKGDKKENNDDGNDESFDGNNDEDNVNESYEIVEEDNDNKEGIEEESVNEDNNNPDVRKTYYEELMELPFYNATSLFKNIGGREESIAIDFLSDMGSVEAMTNLFQFLARALNIDWDVIEEFIDLSNFSSIKLSVLQAICSLNDEKQNQVI